MKTIFFVMLTLLYRFYTKICGKLYKFFDFLRTNVIFIGNKVSFESFRTCGCPMVFVDKCGKMVIGKNFAMNNALKGNQIGFCSPCIFVVGKACLLNIGDNVGVSQTTIIALADVFVGNNVKMGGGVKIYTTDFHSLDYNERRIRNLDMNARKCAPIHIEDDAFIGAGSIILKGVTIGSRAIIGANSVVTKSVPSDQIWAGNPARFVRNI